MQRLVNVRCPLVPVRPVVAGLHPPVVWMHRWVFLLEMTMEVTNSSCIGARVDLVMAFSCVMKSSDAGLLRGQRQGGGGDVSAQLTGGTACRGRP
ncbi:Protein of unknown function [Gryllus bimaculatus]|nr:Protein of unknown function [Gryllus bimaculatus]